MATVGRNVEIKARAREVAGQRAAAERLADAAPEVLRQVDTFFDVHHGRLKLREFGGAAGELIHYERPDRAGPKQSKYSIVATDRPDELRETLAAALGVRGVVRKKRWVYLVGQTRIHFDDVEGLGWFIELEVVLEPGQSVERGREIAEGIMAEIAIRDEDLVDCAYVDLLT